MLKTDKIDDLFLEKSFNWFENEDLRYITATKLFSKEDQINWYSNLNNRNDYKVFGVKFDDDWIGAFGLKNIDYQLKTSKFWCYLGEENWRGKGVGRWMVLNAIQECIKLKLKTLYLDVLKENNIAISLYESVGFKIDNQNHNFIRYKINLTGDIEEYQRRYISDYGFEMVMVKMRKKLITEKLIKYKPKYIIEIGCGLESFYSIIQEHGIPIKKWIIVDPGKIFLHSLEKTSQLVLINNFFEKSQNSIIKEIPLNSRDGVFILCSSLLHEIQTIDLMLTVIKNIMKISNDTVVHVNVPNSNSLHRRLAQSMGLINELNDLSKRNIMLFQSRVFNLNSLETLFINNDFNIIDSGGYFVKPFTHKQMEQINFFSDSLAEGLYRLGQNLPDIAAEIFIDARLSKNV